VGGGGAPRLPRVIVNPYSDKPEELGPIETRLLKAGDIIRFERSGGAGFGDPLTRAREAVADDVRNGYISREAAMQVYGLADPPAD
jgi:N-methylhydantoinase B